MYLVLQQHWNFFAFHYLVHKYFFHLFVGWLTFLSIAHLGLYKLVRIEYTVNVLICKKHPKRKSTEAKREKQ